MRKKKNTHSKPSSKNQISLDKRYIEQLNYLYTEKDTLYEKKKTRDSLRNQIKEIRSKNIMYGQNTYDNESQLSNQLTSIENEIQMIESDTKINDFIFNTCCLVSDYIKLNDMNQQKNDQEDILTDILNQKRELSKEYDKVLGIEKIDEYTLKNSESFCSKCNEYYITNEGYLICPSCGIAKQTIETSAQLSFKEQQEYDYKPQFTYKKESHFLDWIRKVQIKDHDLIPDSLITKVKQELVKEKITESKDLTYVKIRSILKKIGESKYYQNIPRIIYQISDIVPLQLSQDLEDKLFNCFLLIVESFDKHKGTRKSLISYPYILRKLFEMFDLHDYCQFFPILKDRTKLRDHDDIFRKIIDDVSKIDPHSPWKFTPTI